MLDRTTITLDINWAPDWIIDEIAEILIARRVKATWFVTHQSAAIERLRRSGDLFELGIHPNCFQGSTQGGSEDAVLSALKQIVPSATCMRTHGLYQSTPFLLKAAAQYGMKADLSIFMPHVPDLCAHRLSLGKAGLWRLPYFWEDDIEAKQPDPIWRHDDPRLGGGGLKIFDFHPIHLALNSSSLDAYEELKRGGSIAEATREQVSQLAYPGIGPRSMFLSLCDKLAGGGKLVREHVRDIESVSV